MEGGKSAPLPTNKGPTTHRFIYTNVSGDASLRPFCGGCSSSLFP